ncbi:hemolymph lipopolysaccharide-binding protein-like [Anabrus simplex]|uniref:hemolymph lipopolysaccharide-binding protein-like n=1 Tax=Anabrus simplex TaxID=316456 RepID=UPI0035A2902B
MHTNMDIVRSGILLVMLAEIGLSQHSLCINEQELIRFTISSKRNETRHRLVEVDLMKNIPVSSNAIDDISLEVSIGRSVFGKSELMRLNTTLMAQEPRVIIRRTDYELFPGVGYYKLHTTAKLWDAARLSCIDEGADLIVLNSEAEANVVKQFFSRKPTFQGSDSSLYIHAGFNDRATEGKYVTITGATLKEAGYDKWDSGEPAGNYNQNVGGVDNNGLLHDIPNAWKLGYICEQGL